MGLSRLNDVNRFGLGNVNDVGSCWPEHCPPEIPEGIWQKLRPGLEENGLRCLKPVLGCCCNKKEENSTTSGMTKEVVAANPTARSVTV